MLETVLQQGTAESGLSLLPESLSRFRTYYEFLCEKNAVMDLTAVTGEDETAKRHFLDSLMLTRYLDFSEKSVIDVGTGAGFPGLPIKIAVPSCRLTLLDAQQKRVLFLQEVCEKMGCEASCIHARAEEACETMRESFDFAVSRAVARLNVLCELCMPFVKKGGWFAAMKGSSGREELEEARNAIGILGGKVRSVEEYTLPGEDIVRTAVLIEKIGNTPEAYPRRFSRIQKKPL